MPVKTAKWRQLNDPDVVANGGEILALAASFQRALVAQNKAPRTVRVYLDSATRLADFLKDAEMPTDIAAIRREHVEKFFIHQLISFKPATASTRYRALQQFFKYLLEEGEISVSPMANMKPPLVPDQPPEVLRDAELRKLLKVCDGGDFVSRRDTAIIRLLIDSGMRRAEIAGLKVSDVHFDQGVALVLGKNRKPRACPFGKKTAQALDRYLRTRSVHPDADGEALWLGRAGAMSDSGVYQMVKDRAASVGVKAYTHLFRHTFAHNWLDQEGNEGDLMQLMGWSSRTMIQRYGASAAGERARNAHRRLALGDRL